MNLACGTNFIYVIIKKGYEMKLYTKTYDLKKKRCILRFLGIKFTFKSDIAKLYSQIQEQNHLLNFLVNINEIPKAN